MSDEFRDRLAAQEGAQVIAFRLGEALHGCDVMLVQEVVTKRRIIPLPDMPPHLQGVLRLRGELVPVLDLAPLLGLTLGEETLRTVLIVESEAGWVGVATDGVHEVMHLPGGLFRATPATARDRDSYVLGVARMEGVLLTLIDLAEMLRDQTTLARGEPS